MFADDRSIFSREHEIQIRQFASVERCLRNADLEQELSLNFQPIFDVTRGEVVAFEALARWDSPELGRIPPNVFIPVAERTDFISQLTADPAAQGARLTRGPGPTTSGFLSIFRRATSAPRKRS